MTSRRHLFIGLAFLALAAPALAHHGWGSFDSAKPLDHSGPVARSTYANPHGVIVAIREGKELTFELAPVARMQARGLAAEDIAPGRTVRIFGYQNTVTPTLYRAEWVEVGGKRVELR